MFGLDDIDLKRIALGIAKEPATKEDGTPLVSNGKEVTKAEKILRSWAVSDSPELQKRFMDLLNDDEITPDSLKGLFEIAVMACCTTDQMRNNILERLKTMGEKYGFRELIEETIQSTIMHKNRTGVLLPHNNRGPINQSDRVQVYEK